ncbi:MAG: VOC family protein [Saprospiraceae bacterium]|nr:VOC family protein [Lewinella sp.]
MHTTLFSQIDHIIFAAPSLEMGNQMILDKLGVIPVPGGKHPGFGTHNSLLKIAPHTYLEVIAPDPEQSSTDRPLWMGVNEVKQPGLIWWAAKTKAISNTVSNAREAGWDMGQVKAGSRITGDGSMLNWQLTDPFRVQEGGILPFLIDWGEGAHPTDTLVDPTCQLVDFQLLHPDPQRIAAYLTLIGLELPVGYSKDPTIIAGLMTPTRIVYL